MRGGGRWMAGVAAMAALLQGCAAGPGASHPAVAVARTAPVAANLAGIQYLYGSGEAAAISRQAWAALVDYAAGAARARRSVVLAPDATLTAPRFMPCGDRPPAAVFDVDETVLLNRGFEYDALAHAHADFDQARWERWERTGVAAVTPVPGAREGIDRLRAMGIAVIFNTNRSAANADFTQRAIEGAGLGPAEHGRTLFLMGDDATGSRKDARRQVIAGRYCVVALGGDQLGDFSDLFALPHFAARRTAVLSPAIEGLWGRGWFVLPNPVYGAGLKGNADAIFPDAGRWTDAGR